ncbi:glycerate kinase [Otariodibacter oris]|uniref:Glycerate kinase n=1 Tax=Otariodibacter oris TaxID=1032623 RepID=A0A420XGW6_9PAST|nr:glycerate kinase [Otariodibacter oris]QGM80075.1 glycerate kinase [Otariodibacter oris]RKR71901.1 glycerate kinase [Otariodibacter oris]
MKIIIAPDSFKESLTALEVANAIEKGIKKVIPNAECIKVPMADGGEGTVQSLVDALSGQLLPVNVTDPLGQEITGFLGVSGDRKVAIIEMAAASGLHLVPIQQRNPLKTTSYGTGELIRYALDLGVEKILLGIGGSATNDGGVGMLQALGAKFLDIEGKEIAWGGEQLANIAHVDLSHLDSRLQSIKIEVACDVDNPLCGEYGASAVFGPQKGATAEMVTILDNALLHFSKIVEKELSVNIRDKAGAGAAGGMGGGLQLLPHVELKAGVDIVIEAVSLAEKIANTDLVITGEGRMDAQSIHGKTPIGIAKIAKRYNKPTIAIVGSLRDDYEVVYKYGIDAVFPIIRQVGTLEQTLNQAEVNLISTAQNVVKLYQMR